MLLTPHDRASHPTQIEVLEANVMLEVTAIVTAIVIGIGLGFILNCLLDRASEVLTCI